MKQILVPLLLLISYPIFAQNPLIGIKGGVSWTNIFSKELGTDSYRTGCTFGITYEQQVSKGILIGTELLYQQRGYETYLMFTDDFGNPLNSDNTKFNSNYIALPIKVGYTIGNKLSGFLNIGIVPSILTESKIILPDIFYVNSVDYKNQTKTFDLAGMTEIGGNYRISKLLLISASFAFQYSFTSNIKTEYAEGATARHYGMNVCAGVKYALKTD